MSELERRYTISELLEIAEEAQRKAKQARDAKEPNGAERFHEWSNTLAALRILNERGVPDSLKDGD
jgi:hypothetical protein